ncbi:hypothetical protein [Pseudoduganella violaceinigra]|uniref:hypothetical protein n=1 Tax=Pseudoduganella violaceinigra TaxID=246602 RepID=UPI00137836EB|nr:hypothetical protein [Pseudoduganella violaceinigra]
MPKIWTEIADPNRHTDFMSDWSIGGRRAAPPSDNLRRRNVLLIEVCQFTFQFHSLEQLNEAIDFFSKTVHPSSRISGVELEHYWQPWSQRLPKGMTSRSRRVRVLAALRKAASGVSVKCIPLTLAL